MLDPNHLFDITVIGGGPVGMFAAYYAGMRKADVQIIESLPELGAKSQRSILKKEIFDVPVLKALLVLSSLLTWLNN